MKTNEITGRDMVFRAKLLAGIAHKDQNNFNLESLETSLKKQISNKKDYTDWIFSDYKGYDIQIDSNPKDNFFYVIYRCDEKGYCKYDGSAEEVHSKKNLDSFLEALLDAKSFIDH